MIKKIFVLLLLTNFLIVFCSCEPTIYSDGLIEYHTLTGEYFVHRLTEEGKKQNIKKKSPNKRSRTGRKIFGNELGKVFLF